MKFHEIIAADGGLKSKGICLTPVNVDVIDYFDASEVQLVEPIQIQANYYQGNDREDDYVRAGNPQVVSEDFKNLVEELDPKAAQFFSTESVNCKTRKRYFLMHVTQVVYCLDRDHSKFLPGFAGKKESIAVGCVDSTKIPSNVHLFRLGEYTPMHYVSEKFYKEFKKRKMKGCLFLLRTVEN